MSSALLSLQAVVRWHFEHREGLAKRVPFYCDPARIGGFAVNPEELSAGTE